MVYPKKKTWLTGNLFSSTKVTGCGEATLLTGPEEKKETQLCQVPQPVSSLEEYKFGTQNGWVQRLFTRGTSGGAYLQAPHLKESQRKRLKRMLCSLQTQNPYTWRPLESKQKQSSRHQKKKTASVRSGKWKKKSQKRERSSSSSSETCDSSESCSTSSSDCEL
nr:ORF3 [Anelloviridae sp.]